MIQRYAHAVVRRYIEAERQRLQPKSIHGFFVRDEPRDRELLRAALEWPSTSTAPSDGEWEQLCRWVRNVDERAMDTFRLAESVVVCESRSENCVACEAKRPRPHVMEQSVVTSVEEIAGQATPLWDKHQVKPTLAMVARKMGLTVAAVKSLQHEALIVVGENIAKGTVH